MPGALKAKVGGQWVLASSAAGGGGAEEIYVGPVDPGAGYDLWIDTDEEAPLTDDLRWNTAWGIVGTGTFFMANPLALDGTFRKITNPINLVTLVGRRYRIVFQARAVITATAGADSSVNFGLYDNGASKIDLADWYCATSGVAGTAYNSTDWGAVIEGDGAAHSFEIWGRAWGTNGTAHVSSNCRYYIEDCGPITGSTLAPMTVTDRWNTSWGQVGATISSDIAVSAGAPGTTVRSLTLSLLAGRKYVVEARQIGSYTTGTVNSNSFQLYLDLDGAVYNSNSTAYPVIVDGAYVSPGGVSWDLTATTGSHTIALRLARNSGTGTMQARFYLTVTDVGPVSGAVAIADPTPAWISMGTLQNGWVWYGGVEMPPAYRKVGDMVQIRGTIKNATPSAGATQTFFTLPVGYRPPYTHTLPCMGVDVNDYGCPGIIVVSVGGNMQTVRSSDNQKPHIETLFEFQYSVTP